jgi:predicted Zn-dependent protease
MKIRHFLVLGLLVAGGGCQTVPGTGRSQLLLTSEADEAQMGAQAYSEILKKERQSQDAQLNAMVSRVGWAIARATENKDFKWEFKVIDNPKVANAFCLPGGKVAVYTGILPITRDEAGLAAVMGHEVAHAIARHGGERVSQQSLVKTGLSVAQVLLGGDPQTGQTITSLLGAGAAVGLILPFSRKHESEADHLGLIYMAKAGYDPHAARELWVRMQKAAAGSERPSEFFSTHPSEETRIKQIEEWMPEAMQHYRAARKRS